jgi:hypothetical protein
MSNQIRNQSEKGMDKDQSHTEQQQKELRGEEQKGNANTGQNQNPGKGAPPRHLKPDNASAAPDKKSVGNEPFPDDNAGSRGQHEDAALVKEEIRSRDA